MERVVEYCSFHLASGHSVKERKNFNKSFMRMDTARLCELASASHYLDLKSLIDLTCRALAKHIQGKNPEEIRVSRQAMLPYASTIRRLIDPL